MPSVKNITDIQNDLIASIYENTIEAISGQTLQDRLRDMAVSYINRITDKQFLNLQEFSASRGYDFNECTVYVGVIYQCTNVLGHTGAWNAANFTALGSGLTTDQLDAINNANAPDASNPFATMNDLSSYAPTLNQVLTAGATSNIGITSTNGKSQITFDGGQTFISYVDGSITGSFTANNTSVNSSWTNGTDNGYFSIDEFATYNYHTQKISFEAPIYNFVSLTASRVPYLDASSNLVVSSITPTELGYLTGATSSLQAQIDALVTGLSWKQAVRVATTAAGTLSSDFFNGQTIDGVVIATGDRILIKDQASATENGIYTVNNVGAPTRSLDMNSGSEFPEATVAIQEGTVNADTQYVCSTNAPVVVGVTNITFVLIGGTTYVGTTNRITVTGNIIDIAATYIGQSSITTLGTITTGVWSGTTLAVAKGGTGLTTLGGTNKLLYTTTTDNISAITTANTAVLTTDGSGVPSWTAQGTAFNKAFGTGASDICVGNDARLSDSRYTKLAAYDNTDHSVTGTTAETYLIGLLVPSLNANSVLWINAQFERSGAAGNSTILVYYNTTNNLSGSPVKIATVTMNSSSDYTVFQRRIANKNSLTTNEIFRVTVASVTDLAANAANLTDLNVDLSGKYIVFSTTNVSSADTITIKNCQLINQQP